MQTDFNALHFQEILNEDLHPKLREDIAKSSEKIALWIHKDTIGDAEWYETLMTAMDDNIKSLASRKRKHWWTPHTKPPLLGIKPHAVVDSPHDIIAAPYA
jgi:hypothetical protein